MKINHAILHILDFDSAVNVMSERELDLESRQVKSFVGTHLRRARTSPDNRRAAFAENSAFAGELKGYLFGDREFVDLSQQVGEFLAGELSRADKVESTDVLVADFEDDDEVRWFAVLLLGSRQAFMHEVGREGGEVRNDIRRHFAILPNPSQKLASFCLVRASTMEVFYQDKRRKIAGEDRMLLPEGLLSCAEGVSGKEAIETVTRVVEQVAEDHGANTAVALARVKAAVAEAVEEDEELPPWDVVDAAFEDEPVMREAVRAGLTEEQVPERVPVERSQVERAQVRNHRIRTDTGITISFPAELVSNTDLIEFVNEPNGLISISLKNIGSIENR
ncbi:nucleoid-associated protein [Collinsella vaginalis]|uniref:nucleoid-associated protein n=1 Tax=Collinsella vaginalis TaxID=1870987 RepID=UPI000A26AB62|nr:nucleoid-associated protein [Collinsella vaginalis]